MAVIGTTANATDRHDRDSVRIRYHPVLGVERVEARYCDHRFGSHAHDALLVGITRAGCEQFEQGGRHGVSHPGQMRFINSGELHAGGAAPGASWSYDALLIGRDAARALVGLDITTAFAVATAADPELAEAFTQVLDAIDSFPDAAETQLALASFLSIALARRSAAAATAPRHETASVKRARDYLDAHALSGIALDALSQVAGLSKFHLLRCFKQMVGMTPWQYQSMRRIEHARALLRQATPLTEVAMACGYADQSHLTRSFRQHVGVTPGAYRRSVARRPERRA